LPADIRLPQGVVDKLNRTPTLDNPLTRKNRRASLVSSSDLHVPDFSNSHFRAKSALENWKLTRRFSTSAKVLTQQYGWAGVCSRAKVLH
jgi:hypothetical protein